MVPKDVFASLKRCPVVFSAAQNSGIAPGRSRRAALRVTGRRHRWQMDTAAASAAVAPRLKDRPLFAVVGCTGTGKTKLGVRLAKEIGGEVVSADSIQVYKGLDVATNKATDEETDGIPHHMMGTVDWGDECNVYQYRNEALKIIQDIYSRGKVPVVVGGTSYYIEAIIYDNLVRRAENEDEDEDDNDGEPTEVAAEGTDTVNTSVEAFREYAPFRNFNDPPTAEGVDAAGRMYADLLTEAVRFGRRMPAVQRLPFKRYRNTFAAVGDDDYRARWPSTASVIDCESAALYAHGVRVLDAVAAGDDRVRYEVLAVDVTAGLRERYTYADVRSRLDAVTSAAASAEGTAAAVAIKEALSRAYDELEKRTQRLALAVLADNERVSVALMSPHALKAHAAYFDPVAANELHPHNTRKVFRTIQIYLMQGKQKSKLFEEQRTQVNGSDVPVVALRFKEVHMFWLTCDVNVLNRRLEERTDDMVKRGLVDELCEFKNELAKKNGTNNFSMDFTKGVLQCIGVKQFQQYLELPNDKRESTEEGREALDEALTAMKYVTKKYARRQMRWINNRFLKPNDKQAVSVYRLDCTDLNQWQQLSDQAVDLALVVLDRKPREEDTLEPMQVDTLNTVLPVYGDYHCDDCSRLFSNDIQYNIHMASKKHIRVMKKRKRKLQDTTLHCDSDNEDKLNCSKKS